MLVRVVRWILKMVDVSIRLVGREIRITIEFAGTTIIDRSFKILSDGQKQFVETLLHVSPKGVL